MTEANTMKIVYDVSDASWKPNDRSFTSIILSEKRIVKTIFDGLKHRFVSLLDVVIMEETEEDFRGVLKKIRGEASGLPEKWFLNTSRTLLVPDALFDPEMMVPMMNNHHKTKISETINSFHIKRLEARMVFTISQKFENLKSDPDLKIPSFVPSDAVWLNRIWLNHKNNSGLRAHFYLHDGFMSLAIFRNEALQFYNTFLTRSPEEVLYFLMFASAQLRIHPQRDTYYYAGAIQKSDQQHDLLLKYIKVLSPEPRPAQFSYCLPMLEIPGHLYFNSFSTPLCES